MKTSVKILLIAVTAMGGFFGGHYLVEGKLPGAEEDRLAPKISVDESGLVRDGKFTASYSDIVDKAAPSVVYIYTTQLLKQRQQPSISPFFDDPLFRRFFGERPSDGNDEIPQKRQGLGSGVIISKDGYILTNTHVIQGADEIEVVLADGKKSYAAEIVGTDPQTDIAVIKINASKLSAITFADSDKLKVGDVAFAIGNPLGVGQSVTMGIISAKGRSGFGMTDYEDYIQTDASINPGNSGGALVDSQGRLIGINTFIVSRSGGNQGIGFAVPSNLARLVMNNLRADGKVVRGYLGAFIQTLSPELAEEFDLESSEGALVSEVLDDGPAAQAGIQTGDVIVKIDGHNVKNSQDLRLRVAGTRPGKKTEFELIRDGKRKTVTLALGELGADRPGSGPAASWSQGSNLLGGVQFNDLDTQQRRRFQIPGDVTGVVVTDVDAESPAYDAGLRPGHVITSINRKPVTSAADAQRIASSSDKNRVLLLIRTPEGTRFMLIKSQ